MNNIVNIDYHIINRCNLNCKACGHFAPLVPHDEPYVDFERAKKELDLLYDKTNQGSIIDRITLTGGEITLNPDLGKIAEYTAKLFPNKVRIWTNALKPNNIIEIKDIIKSNNIEVYSTNYGHKNNNGLNTLSDNNVLDVYIGSHVADYSSDVVNDWYYSFFSKNKVASEEQINWCLNNLQCSQYKEGKLYHCQYTAYFKYFADRFKGMHNIDYYDEGLDLNTVESVEDIDKFFKTKLNICNHCNDISGNTKHGQWDISRKNINEWYE